MPPKEIKVKIGINDYTIKNPNNGQRIDIESAKMRMTSSKFKDLLFGDAAAMDAYVLTAAIATFSVLIGDDLKKDMGGASLLDLDPLQSKTLTSAYEKYYEWQNKWRDYINQE